MKKVTLCLCGVFLLAAILALSGCNNPIMENILQKKVITFNSNGGTPVDSQTIYRNQKITRPNDPTNASNPNPNSVFKGWSREQQPPSGTTPPSPPLSPASGYWDFDVDIPDGDMTLYAWWSSN